VCGWVLGVNKTAYLVLSLLALVGAYVAGREHNGGWEAAARGAVAGAFFGGAILLVHNATGKAPKVKLPDPEILLLAITIGVSALACGFGGSDRASFEEREGGPQGFSLKRLHWSEPLGFVAAAILLGSLWLPWFSTSSSNRNSIIGTAGIGPGQSATGWQTFRILDLLLAAESARFGLVETVVGLTPAIAKKVGATGNITNVPSVDSEIAACSAKLAQDRITCWENVDRKLMETIVPWVPYLWPNNVFIIGPNVTHWNYDQFTDGPAYSSVSVK